MHTLLDGMGMSPTLSWRQKSRIRSSFNTFSQFPCSVDEKVENWASKEIYPLSEWAEIEKSLSPIVIGFIFKDGCSHVSQPIRCSAEQICYPSQCGIMLGLLWSVGWGRNDTVSLLGIALNGLLLSFLAFGDVYSGCSFSLNQSTIMWEAKS